MAAAITPAQERQLAWRRQQAQLIHAAAGDDHQLQELLLWAATEAQQERQQQAAALGAALKTAVLCGPGRLLRERRAGSDRVSEPASTTAIGVAGAEPPPNSATTMGRFQSTSPTGAIWRSATVNLRADEFAAVDQLAAAAGMSRSGWLRELVRHALAEQTAIKPAA
jgi:hypothetical protein